MEPKDTYRSRSESHSVGTLHGEVTAEGEVVSSEESSSEGWYEGDWEIEEGESRPETSGELENK